MKMKPVEMKGATKAPTHRETADEYANVILRRGRYRVAACRDQLQWLFQRRRRHIKPGATAWDTLGYCVTRAALIRLTRQHIGLTWPGVMALPERFKRESGQ